MTERAHNGGLFRVEGCQAIEWVQDAGRILLINKHTGQTWLLMGQEMIIWDLLQLGYSWQKLSRFLSSIEAITISEAERMLSQVMEKWLSAGVLKSTEMTDTPARLMGKGG